MPEQRGPEPGGLEGTAEPEDEGHEALRLRRRAASQSRGLGPEGREADQASSRAGVWRSDEGAMPEQVEQVLRPGREAASPALDELAARAEPAGGLAQAVDLGGGDGVEGEPGRMNFAREGVAGEDSLASAAGQAAREDNGDPLVAPAPVHEAAGNPCAGQGQASALAARAAAALEQRVSLAGNGVLVVARLDCRYVDHVLLDDPTNAGQSRTWGRLFLYAERPPIAPKGLLAAGNATSGLRFSASLGHDTQFPSLVGKYLSGVVDVSIQRNNVSSVWREAHRINEVHRVVRAVVLRVPSLPRIAPHAKRIAADKAPRLGVVIPQAVVIEPAVFLESAKAAPTYPPEPSTPPAPPPSPPPPSPPPSPSSSSRRA